MHLKRKLKALFVGLYKQLLSPVLGILWIFTVIIVIPLFVAIVSGRDLFGEVIEFFAIQISFLIALEIGFRLSYRFKYGGPYKNLIRVPIEKIFVEPHPYIPFVNKKHFLISASIANYPLHKGRFSFDKYFTNNLRFSNGVDDSRDVVVPKPANLFRINCIGASTTGNYIHYNDTSYSYPLELEKILQSRHGDFIEVNNCGQGGYNSADILVRFLLQVADTDPDVIIIYHGYNDISAFLTEEFMSDYSHVRRNLGESYWKFALAAKIPITPFKFLNFLFEKWMPIDSRNSLLGQVSKGTFNTELDPKLGLQTYKRNLQYIIEICKARKIQVILSTYCHFLYVAIKEDPFHLLYNKIVKKENEIMRELATENKLVLVDNSVLVPQEEEFFVDSIHFTPSGMRLIAMNIAQVLEKLISKKTVPRKENK